MGCIFFNILRWIEILVNYKDGNGCVFRIKSPKTDNGVRVIPLTTAACDAFREIRLQNFQLGYSCTAVIDGYTDFIFITKHGRPMMPNGVNNILYNIIKHYNEYEEELSAKQEREPIYIKKFSAHGRVIIRTS